MDVWPKSIKQLDQSIKTFFTKLCSACEAGDCSVGLWPPWTLWVSWLSCDWLEWECLCQKCLCWHPLAADVSKSQTSSCLLAPVASNLKTVSGWTFVSHGFASSSRLFSYHMEHWENTLHSSSLRYPEVLLILLRYLRYPKSFEVLLILDIWSSNINLFHHQRVSLELVVADYDRWPNHNFKSMFFKYSSYREMLLQRYVLCKCFCWKLIFNFPQDW